LTQSAANQDRYLEDLVVGEVWTSQPIEITAEGIREFGTRYDPQPFHVDDELAKASPFGELIASGWHVAALAMQAYVEDKPLGSTAVLGMGVDELRWLRPVKAGARLTFRREVLSVTRSASRPERGVVRTLVTVTDQNDTTVMKLTTLTQIPSRPATHSA
jgi:acyl dehydratase